MGHLSGDTDRVRARIIQSADPAKRPIARGSATPLAAHHGLALSRILDRRYRLCGFSSNSAAEDPRAPSGERCPPTSARIEPRWVFGDPRSRRTTPGAGRLRREYGRLFPDTVTASDWLLVCWFPSSGLGTQCVKLPLHVSITRLASPRCGSQWFTVAVRKCGHDSLANTVTASRHGELSKGAGDARLTLSAVDYALPNSNVGMSSGKLELPDRVPKPERIGQAVGSPNGHSPLSQGAGATPAWQANWEPASAAGGRRPPCGRSAIPLPCGLAAPGAWQAAYL